MERDFLSLSFQSVSLNVKEEMNDDSKNSSVAAERGSGMQWSFSNKVSAVPQFLSFKAPPENRSRKAVHDTLGPSTMMTISCADAFDTNQKTFPSAIQKSYIQEKQAGNHIAMTVYHPQEMKIYPGTNQPAQAIPVSLTTPVVQSHVASTVKNVIPSTMKPQTFGGLPIISSVPVLPSNSSVVGTTDLRTTSKPSGAPAQLTIFYGGSVNVYEDIYPEKAQAIMLLAGNGSLPSQNTQAPVAPAVEASVPRPATADGFIRSWSFPGLPSPISVTMRPDPQCVGGSNGSNGLGVAKTVGASASSSNLQLPEPPRVVTSVGPPTTTAIPSVAVPQARKASLARFLEKRKERVISAAPYNMPDKTSNCVVPGPDGTSLSVNSSSSSPFSAVN